MRSKQKSESHRPRFMRAWFLGLAGLLVASVYFYHSYQQRQEHFVNANYFRTLQEASQELNAKLEQLDRLHKYKESETTIRVLFPSYRRLDDSNDAAKKKNQDCTDTDDQSVLKGNKLFICRAGKSFEVNLDDILPVPKNDFLIYLLADSSNRVLSKSGDATGVSIVDTKDISQQIQEQKDRKWLDLTSGQGDTKPSLLQTLPGHTYHIDVELTSGPSRLYIHPFNIHPSLSLNRAVTVDGAPQPAVYLIGVLPDNLLDMKDNQRWNLSLLILYLVGLVFAWTLIRLFMLSRNQPVGEAFYRCTMFCSYLFFVLLASLLLAFGEQRAEIAYKQQVAASLMQEMKVDLEVELKSLFGQLDAYRDYYKKLLVASTETAQQETADATSDPVAESRASQHYDPSKIQNWTTFRGGSPCIASIGNRIPAIIFHDGSGFELVPDWLTPLELYREKIVLEPPDLKQTEEPLTDLINIYGRNVRLIPEIPFGEWFKAEEKRSNDKNCGFLDVFLMDETGKQILPMFYFMESNKAPASYRLAHRDYFRKVRDDQGMTHSLEPNFYIQRLLNINTGTRGTTLGVPLLKNPIESQYSEEDFQKLSGKVMGADIVLASLSLTEWRNAGFLLDMIPMVVDRDSGDVLFHMDDDRAMVENLFNSGSGSEAISHRIRSGMNTRGTPLPGYYHGRQGSFYAEGLIIDRWALVVFVPDDNSESYMSNLFLVNSLSMMLLLTLAASFLFVLRRLFNTGEIKRWLGIPLVINRRKIMIFSSVYIASGYFGYWLGSSLDRTYPESTPIYASVQLAAVAMLSCLFWGCRNYYKFYSSSRQKERYPLNPNRGALILLASFLIFGCLITTYLHRVGPMSISAMHWYYHSNLQPARLNQELQELKKIALSRYPNSITRFHQNPLQLMPISSEWRDQLSKGKDCPEHSVKVAPGYLTPADIGQFSQFTSGTQSLGWIQRFLLNSVDNPPAQRKTCSDKAPKPATKADDTPASRFDSWEGAKTLLLNNAKDERAFPRPGTPLYYYLFMLSAFLLLCIAWISFNRRVLSVRLFGTPYFLRHLNQLANRAPTGNLRSPDDHLRIDLKHNPEQGESLTWLLSLAEQREQTDVTDQSIELLTRLCQLLAEAAPADPFPSMRIRIDTIDGELSVHLWDLEPGLQQADRRELLLRLINYLKSLRISGAISELTLYLGFQSLERLLLKSNNLVSADADQHQPASAEYAAWAECLMDFEVILPEDILDHIDKAFIKNECDAFSLPFGLPEPLPSPEKPRDSIDLLRWFNLQDWQKTHSEWASINYILLKAVAIYRFKWESCSADQKLALYHLALDKRINPFNSQMLEQLALERLIKIKCGRIRIVNRSFAYFVRHAEDGETLKHLVQSGEVGAWQDYRAPITLLILFSVGAVALTSGNSLYMIAASVLGLLGTIGSLTNSARLIRDNLDN